MLIANSTFTNNSAPKGGAIANNGAHLSMNFSTIAGNSGTDAGAIYQFTGGGLNLSDSIVANSVGGPNGAGLLALHYSNLSYPDNTCPGIVVDPKLGPLADNGGPTNTAALLDAGAAIDAAAPSGYNHRPTRLPTSPGQWVRPRRL